MLNGAVLSLTLLATLSLSDLTLGRMHWAERDGGAVLLNPRRFGQEHPQVISDLGSACPGQVCGVLAGAAITPLLAAQGECTQQDMADQIIDESKQFDAATQANMLALAKVYRQAEKNTPPDFTTNPPTPRNSVFCQKAPKHPELNCLVQKQDPANDPNLFFDPAKGQTSVKKGTQANTQPFCQTNKANLQGGSNGTGNATTNTDTQTPTPSPPPSTPLKGAAKPTNTDIQTPTPSSPPSTPLKGAAKPTNTDIQTPTPSPPPSTPLKGAAKPPNTDIQTPTPSSPPSTPLATPSSGCTPQSSTQNTAKTSSTGQNLQTFTDSLGSPALAVTQTSNGEFQVQGNASFKILANALQRSCDIQKNACADAANSSGNKGALTVAACETQHQNCLLKRGN